MRRSGGSRSRRSGLIIEENAHGKDGPSENELAAWSSERPEAHSWTDVSRSEKRLARPERFELPTYSSGGCRSIQLSYGRAICSLHLDPGAIKCRRLFRQCGKTCSTYVREELPATASTTAAALTAATTTAAAGAFGFGTRFVYVQCSSTNLG